METNSPLKIFLVDDERYCLHLYARYLNNLGYTRLQYFSKSAECLNQLTLKPDLIFLDYNMDNLNGIDILRKIAVNALKYGALDYITKDNLDESRIGKCLDKVLQIREILHKKSNLGRVKKIFSGFINL